jgi:hypothetical protein
LKVPVAARRLAAEVWMIWSAVTSKLLGIMAREVTEKRLPTGKLTGTVPVSVLVN